jgi:hypothetical protein
MQWMSAASALIGALIGALVAGFFTLRAKRDEYINDYFKIVLNKRVEAYEHLEVLIQAYKTTFVDVDNTAYHAPFASKSLSENAFGLMSPATDSGLWLTDETFEVLQNLNYIMFGEPNDDNARIAFGKKHYQEIANLREKLETRLASDMLELHKIAKFLKTKKKRSLGFHAVRLEHKTKE